jgi:hypothetical protein
LKLFALHIYSFFREELGSETELIKEEFMKIVEILSSIIIIATTQVNRTTVIKTIIKVKQIPMNQSAKEGC